MNRTPQAPKHLTDQSRAWWREVVREYDLEPHHLRVLQLACECWDRILENRAAIDADGSYFRDRFDQIKGHPALSDERQNKILFARLVRELALDVEAPADMVGRPPSIVPLADRKVR